MEEQHFLGIVLLILSAAVLVVASFKKLKLSPVLGYFVAGGLIGEHGLNYVRSSETEVLGEVGVIFLLFAIGLELTFERLKAMRVYVFGFGSLQVILSALAIGIVATLLGESTTSSIILGGGLALSSTAIVLQVIAEKRQQSTQVGRLSLAVLLMQDFAVVPLLVMIPILSSNEHTSFIQPLGEAFIKTILVLVFIFVVGRIVLRPMFKMNASANSAETNEVFIATTILIALGTAFLTNYMGLSLALGAFAAGLLVAETEFQLQAEESIAPFKGLFLGLFFMSVGMTINLQTLLDNVSLISSLSIGLITIKATIIIILALVFRFNVGNSIHVGLLLSQGSEFAFILFRIAENEHIFKINNDILLLVVTITMAFTPILSLVGSWIAKKLDKKNVKLNFIYKDIADLSNHVLVLGFGRVGQMVGRLLAAEKVNFIAIDIDPEHVALERQKGIPVYLGDASSLELLNSVGIARASSVIITMSNEITLKKAAKIIAKNYPRLPVVVRAKDLSKSTELYSSGASIIVPETYETGLQLGGAVLKSIGVSEFEVSRIKNQFRAGNYVKLPKLEEELSENA